MSGERGRDAAAERRIKVSDNVIYGIDLNPAFKLRAIIQSRSPFPSFFTSAALPFPSSFPSLASASRSAAYYPSRACSILNIYLNTSELLPHNTYAYCEHRWLLKTSLILSSSIINRFFMRLYYAAWYNILQLVILLLHPYPTHC